MKELIDMTIYEKLQKVQEELNSPKNKYNNFGGFSYRSAEDMYSIIKPILTKYKVLMYMTDDVVNIGDRYYIRATVALVDMEGAENAIYSTAMAREALSKKGMDEAQITGGASSYARKYAMCGMFLIDGGEDPDTLECDNSEKELMTEEQKEKFKELGVDIEKVAIYYKTTVEDITKSQAEDAITRKERKNNGN